MQNPAVLLLDRFAHLFHKAVSLYRLSHSLFCCLYCEEQKLSSTSVGVALCLCVKLSDSDVMTPCNLSPGTEKMLRAVKRWPWVMHYISRKHFCLYRFFSKANGRRNTSIWTQKCLQSLWRGFFVSEVVVIKALYCACC